MLKTVFALFALTFGPMGCKRLFNSEESAQVKDAPVSPAFDQKCRERGGITNTQAPICFCNGSSFDPDTSRCQKIDGGPCTVTINRYNIVPEFHRDLVFCQNAPSAVYVNVVDRRGCAALDGVRSRCEADPGGSYELPTETASCYRFVSADVIESRCSSQHIIPDATSDTQQRSPNGESEPEFQLHRN